MPSGLRWSNGFPCRQLAWSCPNAGHATETSVTRCLTQVAHLLLRCGCGVHALVAFKPLSSVGLETMGQAKHNRTVNLSQVWNTREVLTGGRNSRAPTRASYQPCRSET